MIQYKYSNLAEATEQAIELSKSSGYAAVIHSDGSYYVEDSDVFIRAWEELIAECENGELLHD